MSRASGGRIVGESGRMFWRISSRYNMAPGRIRPNRLPRHSFGGCRGVASMSSTPPPHARPRPAVCHRCGQPLQGAGQVADWYYLGGRS